MQNYRLLLVFCAMILSFGNLPAQDDQAVKDELVGEFATTQSIEARLKQVRDELKQLDPDSQPKLRELLAELETSCLQHLNDVELTKKKQEENKAASMALETWEGFTQAPPYSIAFVDDLRMTRANLQAELESVKSMIRIFTRSVEDARNQLQQHQQAERRANDSVKSGSQSGTGAGVQAAAAREEEVSSRIAAEKISRLIQRQVGQRAELASIESRLELTSRQLEVAEKNVVFSRQELDQILKKLEAERAEAVKVLNAAMAKLKGNHEIEGWRITFLDLQRTFWNHRFNALNSEDPDVEKEALKKFNEQLALIEYWSAIEKVRVAETGREGGQDALPDSTNGARQEIADQKLRLGFAIAELSGDVLKPSVGVDHFTNILRSIWNMELYLAEQNVFIDGKKVVSYRAVTLGKVLRFLIILVIGYFLLRYLSLRLRRFLTKRERATETAIDFVSRTFFGSGLFLLLIYGLNIAHIPLTAFAFLGGALAIGVGFGTQTLLKNLISGIILAFERPFKVGDVVEAGGVTGRIRSIGIRASTIQHFDGIETLIPNSTLLEEQVTNWSLSNPLIRRTISVGVAYGSPAREVSNRLLGIAAEHGLVLDTPKPEVRFVDFGDNALNFELLIWIDGKTIQGATLDSDIRFMIDKAFSAANIVISFPQRDIHFDTDRPLKVEWSKGPPPEV
jgi:small-conductance mechanosensitive channel